MIGIRVDVNQVIATGHIKRDIEIALCLREMGQECLFLSADDKCLPYLEPYGFHSVILESRWDDMEGELEQLKAAIEKYGIDSLLVDSYMITEAYMKQLKQMTVVTYFDELGKFGYGCQQLINGVLVPPDYTKAPGKALLGPEYVSLRQEFSNLPAKSIRPRIEKLLITSGGTDNYHFCVQFLEFFMEKPQWQHVKVMVAVGDLSADKEILKQRYGNVERVELHINSQHMAGLMQDADYAVTAGGTTLYEVCAAGVSASCYVIADNQLDIAESFHDRGLISFAGDFREDPCRTMQQILRQMMQVGPEEVRREKAARLQNIVDGKGAWRIAKALVKAPYQCKTLPGAAE